MPMLRTAFTDLLGADLPIAGFNRSPAVVAAVCNAGGLGVLAASGYRPDELDAQLTWIEEQTGGRPYGVDRSSRRSSRPATPATWSPACGRRSRTSTWPSSAACSTGTACPPPPPRPARPPPAD